MGGVEPLMPVLDERQRTAKLCPGDDTRWDVCEEVEGPTGHRWDLWVMQSVSGVDDRRAPGRGADVPKGHGAKVRKDLRKGVLVGDRSSAEKSLALDGDELMGAFGWAHGRRDCLKAARRWPELARGMGTWVDDLRALYHLHVARVPEWEAG